MNPLVEEKLAEYAHDAWAGWMQYLFSKGEFRQIDGHVGTVWIMPAWAVDRWQRQMNTSYAELSEDEKRDDRVEAGRMLSIVKDHL